MEFQITWFFIVEIGLIIKFHFLKLSMFYLCLRVGQLLFPPFSTLLYVFCVILNVYMSYNKIQYSYNLYLTWLIFSIIGLKSFHRHGNIFFHYDRTRQTYFLRHVFSMGIASCFLLTRQKTSNKKQPFFPLKCIEIKKSK